MSDITAIALSGMKAAERRISNSAENIVNARTEGYKATDAVQKSVDNGGVIVDVRERDPATVKQVTENGVKELPNVSLEREVVDSVVASNDFDASARLLKVAKELDKSLLDIQA